VIATQVKVYLSRYFFVLKEAVVVRVENAEITEEDGTKTEYVFLKKRVYYGRRYEYHWFAGEVTLIDKFYMKHLLLHAQALRVHPLHTTGGTGATVRWVSGKPVI
jgi:hypothetical protein